MASGHRLQSSRTAFSPTDMTSAAFLSVTKLSATALSTGDSASGGTSSWADCAAYWSILEFTVKGKRTVSIVLRNLVSRKTH